MNRMNSFLLVVAFALGTLSLTAQEDILKANKFYELYAFDLAITHFEKALGEKENLVAMTKLADCYRQVNELEKAADWYQKIYSKPDKADIDIFLYAQTLKSLGRYTEAKKLFQEYEKTNPTIGSYYAASCNFALRNSDKPSLFEMAAMSAANSKETDFAPSFLGDKLIFSSFRKDDLDESGETEFNKSQNHQFYSSSITSQGQVNTADVLRKGIMSSHNLAYASPSATANSIAFVKTNSNFANGVLPLAGSGAKMDIYLGEMASSNSWDEVKPFPYNDSKYATGYPSLSADGRTLYFASNRPGGFGGYDLYVSSKIGSQWSEPKNLGAAINSQGNEISPSMDGNTLYFSSDWHLGYGGLDVFKTESKNGNWSAVKNLGPAINSWSNDYDFVYSEKYDLGFFVSNRSGGKGKDDIYKVKKIAVASNIQVVLVDEESEDPIEGALVDLSTCGHGIYKTDEKGLVTIPAIVGKTCEAMVQKTGFKATTSSVTLSDPKQKTITIKMPRLRSFFVGVIRNSETEDAVQDVQVTLTDAQGKATKVTTDENGRYALALEPNAAYEISYSKAGFVNKGKVVKTGKVIDHNLLGAIEVEPSPFSNQPTYVAADRPEMPKHLREEASGKGSQELFPSRREVAEIPKETRPKEEMAPKEVTTKEVVIKEVAKKAVTKKETTSESNLVFEIQIGAFSKPNLKLQRNLADVGMVYTDRRNELLLYKVGTFSSKTKAQNALSEVKGRGYSDAFIREVKTDNPIVRAISNMSDKEAPKTEVKEEKVAEKVIEKPVEKPVAKTTTPPKAKTYEGIVFRVQLGAFRSSTEVAYSKSLLKVGKLSTTTTDKGITIYLLGDFDSLTAAQSAKGIAVEEGVEKAFVVAFKNGKKMSIQEAIE